MDRDVQNSNSPAAMSDSPCSWAAPINHGISVTAQSPRPKIPIPLLHMDDSDIANGYASFLRHGDSLHSGLKDPSLDLPISSTPLTPVPNPLLGFEDLEVGAHHPDFVQPASLLYNDLPYNWIFEAVDHHGRRLWFVGPTDWLYMPRDTSLDFIDRPSSSDLPDFKPTLYWQQPLNILFCEDRPGDGIDDYLTDIDFDDPTKPYPVPHHELAAAISSNHYPIQRLISWNPSSSDERAKVAGYAHLFSQYQRQLEELAGELKVNIWRGVSLDEIEEDILNWGIMLSAGQQRRLLDVLDEIAQIEAAIKKGWGYVLDEPLKGNQQLVGLNMLAYGLDKSLKCDQQLVLCMRRRLPLARMTIGDNEGFELFAGNEPLEALFGLKTEDEGLESSTEHVPVATLFGLDAEDDGFICFAENESLEMPFESNTEDDGSASLMNIESLERLLDTKDNGFISVTGHKSLETPSELDTDDDGLASFMEIKSLEALLD